jgi:hypothetical protein
MTCEQAELNDGEVCKKVINGNQLYKTLFCCKTCGGCPPPSARWHLFDNRTQGDYPIFAVVDRRTGTGGDRGA